MKNWLIYFQKGKSFRKLAYCPSFLRYRFKSQLLRLFQLRLYRTLYQDLQKLKDTNPQKFRDPQLQALELMTQLLLYLQDEDKILPILKQVLLQVDLGFFKQMLSVLLSHHSKFALNLLISRQFTPLISISQSQLNDARLIEIALLLALQFDFYGEEGLDKLLKQLDLSKSQVLSLPEGELLFANFFCDYGLKKLRFFNQFLAKFNLSPFYLTDQYQFFCIKNLRVLPSDSHYDFNSNFFVKNVIEVDDLKQPLVSILVTTHNSQDYIEPCLLSLLTQTWKNLQIIVVDDASTDNTIDKVECLRKVDSRIQLVKLKYNVGTFAAKSIGALWANGEFLTCQDSDDFAHPQKIERQMQPLLRDNHLIASISYWVRVDDFGRFYVRQHYPFLRQNTASLLFRRSRVQTTCGFWHLVRTGADSELIERLKHTFGGQAIFTIKEPLTLASHRKESLTMSDEFGVHNQKARSERMAYWMAWQNWHLDQVRMGKPIVMPDLLSQVRQDYFVVSDIPERIQVDRLSVIDNLRNLPLSDAKIDEAILDNLFVD